jgi:hypothetical protein
VRSGEVEVEDLAFSMSSAAKGVTLIFLLLLLASMSRDPAVIAVCDVSSSDTETEDTSPPPLLRCREIFG